MLSIIVPVYNVEKYLPECIESILQQDYQNIQLILIDDGSTDSSGNICDDYANKDKRIIVEHITNSGVSEARNYGKTLAKGKYISFVDSDDYVSHDFYEPHISLLERDASIDFIQVPIKGRTIHNVVLQGQKQFFDYWIVRNKILTNYVGDKIFRSSVLEDLKFPKGRRYEDRFLFVDILKKVHKIYLSDMGTYIYRSHPEQVTKQSDKKFVQDMLYANLNILNKLPRECISAFVRCYWDSLVLLETLDNSTATNKILAEQLNTLFPLLKTIWFSSLPLGIKFKLTLIKFQCNL